MPLRYHLNALTAVRNEDTHGQHVPTPTRAREGGCNVRDGILSRAWLRVSSLRSADVSFASPRLPILLPSTVERCPMPSTRYEACLITRSVHGPIELPSCRRSPSPLSRSPLESVVSPFSVRASPPHVRPRLRCLTLSTGSVLLSDEDHRFSFIARTVPPRSLRSIIRSVRVRIHYPFAPKNV